MWSNEQPKPSDEFSQQVKMSDRAIEQLMKEIGRLDGVFKTSGDEEVEKQLEYLKGFTMGYKGVKNVLKLKEVAMSQKWDNSLDPINVLHGQEERDDLAKSYAQLIKLMNVYEVATYKVMAAPTGWFATTIAQWEDWVDKNPGTAILGVVGGCSLFAAVGALVGLAADVTACGLSCQAAAVAAHAAVGGLIGGVVSVAILLVMAAAYGAYTSCRPRKNEKTDIQKIEEMVEALKNIPENEFSNQLEDIIAKCSAMAVTIPAQEDWKCPLCLAEGHDLKEPVRAHGCQRSHVVCKACWLQYTKIPAGNEGKCPLCRQ